MWWALAADHQLGAYPMVESMGCGIMGLKYISALPWATVAVNSVSSDLPYKYPGVRVKP